MSHRSPGVNLTSTEKNELLTVLQINFTFAIQNEEMAQWKTDWQKLNSKLLSNTISAYQVHKEMISTKF